MAQKRVYRVVAEFSIHPVGEGTSVSRYVRAAVSELKKARGLRLEVTPMATVMEAGKLSDILSAAGQPTSHCSASGQRESTSC